MDITLHMDGKEEFLSGQLSPKEARLRALIKLCAKDERAAQFELYELSFDFLYRIAIRYEKNHDDAIAVINEAFYKVLTHIGSYRQENSFYPWIKTILVNCILTKFRKSNTIKHGGKNDMVSFEDEYVNASIEPDIFGKIDSEHILSILDCLPELTRKVFNLFVMEDYSHKEIAKALDINVNSSRWHVFQAKKRLLKEMQSKKAEHETRKR